MFDCTRVQQELTALHQGECLPLERAALEAHLAGCASCRAAYDEVRGVFRLFAQVPSLEPQMSFRERIARVFTRSEDAPAGHSVRPLDRLGAGAEPVEGRAEEAPVEPLRACPGRDPVAHGDAAPAAPRAAVCEGFGEDLTAFAAGQYKPEPEAPFLAHVRGCEACQCELDRLDQLFDLSALLPRLAAGPALYAGVKARLPQLQARRRRGRPVRAYLARVRRSPTQRLLAAAHAIARQGRAGRYYAGVLAAHCALLFLFSLLYRAPARESPPQAAIAIDGVWEWLRGLPTRLEGPPPQLPERAPPAGGVLVAADSGGPPEVPRTAFDDAGAGDGVRGGAAPPAGAPAGPAFGAGAGAGGVPPGVLRAPWARLRQEWRAGSALVAHRRQLLRPAAKDAFLVSRLGGDETLAGRRAALVARGLASLALAQRADGAWGSGDGRHDVETTGLVVLAFQADGFHSGLTEHALDAGAAVSPAAGDEGRARALDYGARVRRALASLTAQQVAATGLFREPRRAVSLQAHAVALTAMLEDFLQSDSEDRHRLRALRDALRYLAVMQDALEGGWRETLDARPDLETTLWCALALALAREHPLLARAVEEEVLARAVRALYLRVDLRSARVRAAPGPAPEATALTTAQGLVLGQVLARRGLAPDFRGFEERLRETLLGAPPPRPGRDSAGAGDYGYWCYGVTALAAAPRHQDFVPFFARVVAALEAREREGVWLGGDDRHTGRDVLHATALAVLALQAPYRYALAAPAAGETAAGRGEQRDF